MKRVKVIGLLVALSLGAQSVEAMPQLFGAAGLRMTQSFERAVSLSLIVLIAIVLVAKVMELQDLKKIMDGGNSKLEKAQEVNRQMNEAAEEEMSDE